MYLLLAFKQDLRNLKLRSVDVIGAYTNHKKAKKIQKEFVDEWHEKSSDFASSFYFFPIIKTKLCLSSSIYLMNQTPPKYFNIKLIENLFSLATITLVK